MRFYNAVAACDSISEAARRVFVTQPTLTESIRALEEERRTAIFTRSARGNVVTLFPDRGDRYISKGLFPA